MFLEDQLIVDLAENHMKSEKVNMYTSDIDEMLRKKNLHSKLHQFNIIEVAL